VSRSNLVVTSTIININTVCCPHGARLQQQQQQLTARSFYRAVIDRTSYADAGFESILEVYKHPQRK